MVDVLSILGSGEWGASVVLMAVLAGGFVLVRQWMNKQDIRENKRIDLEHERAKEHNGAMVGIEAAKLDFQKLDLERQKKDTDFLRKLLEDMRAESNQTVTSLMALSNDQNLANRQVAKAINELAREIRDTNQMIGQIVEGRST